MSGELPILSRHQPPCTIAVFYESGSGRYRIEVWCDTGLKATAWIRADYEPRFGVDVADMQRIEEEIAAIIRGFETVEGETRRV